MFRRILFSSIAAASIVPATPALANDPSAVAAAPTKDACGDVQRCCAEMAMGTHGRAARDEATEQKKAASRKDDQTNQRTVEARRPRGHR